MKCPVCNEETFYEWAKVGSYSIVRCKMCGMGITSPFPTAADLLKINEEIYQVKQRMQAYLSRQVYFEKRYRKYLREIKYYKKNGKLLDIGCNIGLFVKVAKDEGFSSTGVEVNRECADYGKKHFNIEIYSDYLENIAFPDKSFDVITLFDVLEHIPDMQLFIAEVRRILKNDGLLVMQLPNIDSLMAKLTQSKWNWLTPPDHLYHFTPKTLAIFMKISGFEIQKIKTWEPAKEFYNNLLSAYSPKSFVSKALYKFLTVTKIVLFLVVLLQKIWCHKYKGGLIEIYASKIEGAQ